MKKFNVPLIYRSRIITTIKNSRRAADKLKKDFTPSVLDLGALQIILARHFGFCYGVENAIEIAFKTVDENQGKRIFLLSEMIHNPHVNEDLKDRGVKFLMDTSGNELIPFSSLNADDIVIIPAFGTTLQISKRLKDVGVKLEAYNTTCPFVQKVWNRAEAIAKKNYTVIIHGKPRHEETRATFSNSEVNAPTVIVKDMAEAIELSKYILGEYPLQKFYDQFAGQYSEGFKIENDLGRIGVVNQTTMLASDTQGISDFLKSVMIKKYALNDKEVEERFADTRDTLCYATNENQDAVYSLLNVEADLALVIGGYNSSNTSHLVELCEEKLPTYFICSKDELLSENEVRHFDLHKKELKITTGYLPQKRPAKIMITSGASCPDALVEEVIEKLIQFYPDANPLDDALQKMVANYQENTP
ncbi:MAG: 4-hydroxy-3-methylbut-2-enyl diphosphate reductase [Bacteroidetes bacterium]|nr:4-hydroxy-3-methylbut-2-enyl diphosphate reductase [Bacteroidota bacterium]